MSELLNTREKTHGKWGTTSKVSQRLKTVLRTSPGDGWEALPEGVREAMYMLCTKMARIVSSGAARLEHVEDIEGYSLLLQESAAEEIVLLMHSVYRGRPLSSAEEQVLEEAKRRLRT